MAGGLLAVSIVPVGIYIFMAIYGFHKPIVIGLLGGVAVLILSVVTVYRRALGQKIVLCRDKIIFDYISNKEEFLFESPDEWELGLEGRNWCFSALKYGTQKLIPVSAFPTLQHAVTTYYGRAA